jgi:hypothetical protein
VKMKKRENGRVRLTCEAHVGPTILKLYFCVELTCGDTIFIIFPKYNCHVSATSMPCGTET